MKKTIGICLILSVALISGCTGTEIDDMAYVVAVGVDKSDKGYNFTFAIGNPNGINSEEAGEALIYEEQQGNDIFSSADMVANRIGQKVNFSHAELMVFSKEVADDGIEDFADALMRNLNQRPKLVFAMSDASAKENLKNLNSKLEGNPEKHLKKVFEGYSSSSSKNNIREFLCRTKTVDAGDTIFVVSVENGEMTIGGMAVLKNGKYIGRIYDIMAYKLIMGEASELSYNIDGVGTVEINQNTNPQIFVSCDDVPRMKINIVLDCTVLSLEEGIKKDELYKDVKMLLEGRVNTLIAYSVSEMQTDFLGFERYGKMQFLTWEDWEKYKWHEKYKDAQYEVNIELNPRKTNLIKGDL